MKSQKNLFINRELSWLEFNERVLSEANDPKVPLIERIRFLGIFSNNLDEFFRVRYATVKRIAVSSNSGKRLFKDRTAKELLNEITLKSKTLQDKSFKILDSIIKLFERENIFFIDENSVESNHKTFISEYFFEYISPSIDVIILNSKKKFPKFKDNLSFLIVRMELENNEIQNAIIRIPKTLNRFVQLPSKKSINQIIIIDDIIRLHLKDIFKIFNPITIEANMVKTSRDAELDFDDDISKSFLDKIAQSVKERSSADPVRFVYDQNINKDTLSFLTKKMGINTETDSVIASRKYHNRRDYMSFPNINSNLTYKSISPVNIPDFSHSDNTFEKLKNRDYLIHTPYNKFSYIISLLMKSSIDPKVKSISITIYRLSKLSKIASALINAARNGKNVKVQIELQARFDESANIKYAKEMQSNGVKLIYGSPNLKVHSKICLIERLENGIIKKYGFISTGNFNESTAKIYTDLTLFTSNEKILSEVSDVFKFFTANYRRYNFKNLIISPINTESRLKKLIQNEITNAKKGNSAWIKVKINNLTSQSIIKSLYDASRNGVKIQMIIRGICCLIPGVKKMSENIEVISIVDRFLEHTRFMIFNNNNNNKVFISSADWMTRNLDNRVEVTCPIFQDDLKDEINHIFEIYWNDNVKSRVVNSKNKNRKTKSKTKHRSQQMMYEYYLNKIEKNKKFATIDIGSNAIRLLISNIYTKDSKIFATKNSLVRVPVRLGQDAFKKGKISKINITRLIDSMKSFQLIMKVHNVEKYLAYATSALRSSSNGELIVNEILNKTGLRVEIISGSKEAKIITNNNKFFSGKKTFCFLDVGGGSTELTLFKNNKIINSKSFKIGGVRLINNLVKSSTWEKLELWISENLCNQKDIRLVGLGGNINKIFKISGNNIGVPLKKYLLDTSLDYLEKMSDFDKTIKLKLNPDRIDVIVPAGKIYQFVMDKLNSKEILVPKIGLADAMVHELIK